MQCRKKFEEQTYSSTASFAHVEIQFERKSSENMQLSIFHFKKCKDEENSGGQNACNREGLNVYWRMTEPKHMIAAVKSFYIDSWELQFLDFLLN
jgi:hypothetical protein